MSPCGCGTGCGNAALQVAKTMCCELHVVAQQHGFELLPIHQRTCSPSRHALLRCLPSPQSPTSTCPDAPLCLMPDRQQLQYPSKVLSPVGMRMVCLHALDDRKRRKALLRVYTARSAKEFLAPPASCTRQQHVVMLQNREGPRSQVPSHLHH